MIFVCSHESENDMGSTRFREEIVEQFLSLVERGYSIRRAAISVGVTEKSVTLRHTEGLENPHSRWADFAERLDKALARGNHAIIEDIRRETDDRVDTTNPFMVADSFYLEQRADAILNTIRTGVYPHVAAEQEGVPRMYFQIWIERGKEEPKSRYRDFYMRYISACAEARASAEERTHRENPLAWLLHGPARDKGDGLGWTKQSEVKSTNVNVSVIETRWGETSALPQIEERGTIQADVTITEENEPLQEPEE